MKFFRAFRQLPRSTMGFLLARGIANFGAAMTAFALDVWIYERTGSYALFATLVIVTTLPGLLFAPLAGVIVDRHSRKRVMLACELLSACAGVVVVLTYHADLLSPLVVGMVVVALALVRTVGIPATWASITSLTNEEDRPKVNGVVETLDGATTLISPVLGAALFKTVGLSWIALFDVMAALLCVAAVSRLPGHLLLGRPSIEHTASSAFRRLLDDCTYGFRWIVARPDLMRLLLFFVIINLGCSVFVVAYTPYVLSFATPAMLGMCLALGGAGMMVGGLVFASTGGMRRHEMGVLLGAICLGATMAAFGTVRTAPLLFVVAFLYGASIPLVNASSQTIWQSQVPAEIQGRVFSIRKMIAWGLNPLSILISIPFAVSVFLPLVTPGTGVPAVQSIWGAGQPGALGLMISACGLLCAVVAMVMLAVNGLRFDHPAVQQASPMP